MHDMQWCSCAMHCQTECLILCDCRFAYIEFKTKDSLSKALDLNGTDYAGQSLVVDEAGEPGGGGGGSRGRGGFGGRGGDRGGRGGGRGNDRGRSFKLIFILSD